MTPQTLTIVIAIGMLVGLTTLAALIKRDVGHDDTRERRER